jgi:hypothetical protein
VHRLANRSALTMRVIKQLERDIINKELDSISVLLDHLSVDVLRAYLPEEVIYPDDDDEE